MTEPLSSSIEPGRAARAGFFWARNCGYILGKENILGKEIQNRRILSMAYKSLKNKAESAILGSVGNAGTTPSRRKVAVSPI
jgi:hypothetical protein